MVKTLKFQDLDVPVPGFGCMGFSMGFGAADDNVSKATLARALELGCTFWDSAVVYGSGHNERLLGEVIAEKKCRDKVFVASKCGFECMGDTGATGLGTVTNKAAHINEYIEGTRERLGFYPDLYYLHRIDPDTPLEESITALQALKTAGKCKYIGLSEPSAATLRKACAIAHIDALQVEYSAFFTDHETNGLLDTARELGVTVVAYSPTAKGMLTGQYRSLDNFASNDTRRGIPRYSAENLPANLAIIDKFVAIAKQKGCTPAQLASAWVIAQDIIPIPGTRVSERLEENFAARDVELSEQELAEIRELIKTAPPVGERYSAAKMALCGN